jgi:hypothetical protein
VLNDERDYADDENEERRTVKEPARHHRREHHDAETRNRGIKPRCAHGKGQRGEEGYAPRHKTHNRRFILRRVVDVTHYVTDAVYGESVVIRVTCLLTYDFAVRGDDFSSAQLHVEQDDD